MPPEAATDSRPALAYAIDICELLPCKAAAKGIEGVAHRTSDLLKTYAVLAIGAEGAAFKLIETFWYRRAVAVFNAAKDSGRWAAVQVKLGNRVCVTFRASLDEPPQRPAGEAAPRPLPRRQPRRPRQLA